MRTCLSLAKITSNTGGGLKYLQLPGQLQIASMNVNGKGSLDQLNRDYKLKVSTRFLDPPPDPLERATGDTYDVACGHRRMRRNRCVLRTDAEGVYLLVIHRQRR